MHSSPLSTEVLYPKLFMLPIPKACYHWSKIHRRDPALGLLASANERRRTPSRPNPSASRRTFHTAHPKDVPRGRLLGKATQARPRTQKAGPLAASTDVCCAPSHSSMTQLYRP
jgi:hypothetical protein